MDYRLVLDRIFQAVEEEAYLTPVHRISGPEADALQLFRQAMGVAGFEPEDVRGLVRRLHTEGRLRKVTMLSCLHIVAAHPKVANWPEAARLAGEQEMAALVESGPMLQADLASVERHRGVLAFLNGHFDVALDYFARAMERERTAENLGNVLCTLIRLGEFEEAASLTTQMRSTYPAPLVAELNERIATDPDLSLLRQEPV